MRYIKQHKRVLYTQLLLFGKLNNHLADINDQAEDMFLRLVKEITHREGITEQLKADNQMEWILRRMNNVRNRAIENILYTY